MRTILPAGQHYGAMLQRWSSPALTVCRIGHSPGTFFAVHGNEQASLLLVERGRCAKQMGRRRFELSRNRMLFIPAQHLQEDSFPEATTFLAAEFRASVLERVHEAGLRLDDPVELSQQDAQEFRRCLLRELAAPDSASGLVFESLLLAVLISASRRRVVRPKGPPPWLGRVKEMLHDRSAEALRLDDIAQTVGVHPAQLSREFRRYFKVTPGDYLRQIRVDLATRELTETEKTLVDIALRTGFSDQAHFSRVFKRHTSLSPSEYRRLTR
jgi:AraC-like DNA-binding protein